MIPPPSITVLRCSRFIAIAGTKHGGNILFWGGCRDHHTPQPSGENPPLLAAAMGRWFWTICRRRHPKSDSKNRCYGGGEASGWWEEWWQAAAIEAIVPTVAEMMNRLQRGGEIPSIGSSLERREVGSSHFPTPSAEAILDSYQVELRRSTKTGEMTILIYPWDF